ncbi:aminotransferase class V-fold PLP-dependent enzyme [Thermosediminibacter oceani]|uniref:cysteine desulfurase n=1 Tax=Thermosediminibacter oceani (strain ATCC BAA-1034 / DSM 16646 / JW/IW-1228P) TaxID=555079 RepID=D9S1A1_THEOJ|nr:aminotransferase class V-fold PLP-dependent enzyme [Thermosediminibacter oceani]ADL08980.1 cysteine desulfurase family protein [Thermosediminibacter oceani DSM 16646]
MIYFDNAATTWPKPEEVYRAVEDAMRNFGGNPGRSGHRMALAAARLVYEARETLAEFFNAESPTNIVFTMNATDALNTAIKGVLKPGDHVITTSMEHNSVARPIFALTKSGVEWDIVRCGTDGSLDPDDVVKAIKPNTRLIAITHASNVTGTIMPVGEIGKIARERGILLLVDAAQSAGVLDIDVQGMNIDLLAFPGHKGLYGPQGTGGLYVREGLQLTPIRQGGTGSFSEELEQPEILPDRLECGTLNTPGIAGLAAGVDFVKKKGLKNIRYHEEQLTQRFLEGLKEIDGVTVYGPEKAADRCAVISLNFNNLDSAELAYLLDSRFDIQVRPGLHCSPLAHRTLGTEDRGTVRFSFSVFNTVEEIDRALEALREISLSSR